MGENENRVNLTLSSSKKRASTATHSLQHSKKRVPLGELTNLPCINSTRNSDFLKIQECILKEGDSSTVELIQSLGVDAREKNVHEMKKMSPEDPENSSNTESTHNSDVETSQQINFRVKARDENQNDVDSSPMSTQDMDLMKPSYSSSMYGYLHSLEMEEKRRCLPNYITAVQTDISVRMREILVDWLVEVAEEYKLVSDTLYLTVSYVDRYLSSQALSRNKLQLLGVSCMHIASKYEEISPPNVEDFCYITDNTYKKEELASMEKDVLEFLKYEMGTPTIKNFLRILTKAAQENCESTNLQFEFLSCYLAELSLLDYECLRFSSSLIAASAVFLSRFTIQAKEHPWNASLQRCSGYRPSDLKECVLTIHDLHLNKKGSNLKAIRDKYTQHKFKRVATLCPGVEIPMCYFETTGKYSSITKELQFEV
ncbi:cyclin-A3-1-like [Euphorbia lathyris]|uniref:cyclin-A3-1-like n=1 Tax=Euphorbia lathyris TaxID=212925 RepID=UPI00331363D1